MDTSSPDTQGNSTSITSDLGIVIAVLESGNSVELPATGYSMFPTLKPGDRVVVKPVMKGEVPTVGSVVVCLRNDLTVEGQNDILVMHRLIEIKDRDSGNPQLITRGDSGSVADKPWPLKQLLGVVVSCKRRGREHLVKSFIPGERRYGCNRRVLWLVGKINRIGRGVSGLRRGDRRQATGVRRDE
jgi:signal peptidase I